MLAIYRRVSKDEQAEFGVSLDNQDLRGKELANKLGLKYEVYTDAGVKGSIPYNKRPALNRLVDDIYAKKITTVFVFDISRLSRGNIVQIETLKTIFKEHNVALYELNGLIDLKDTNVEFITDIRSLVNAKFLKDLSSHFKSILESRVQEGKVTGGPMQKYGYTKDENKTLVINPEEAKVVKLIFKLAIEGKGTKVIANILNEKGIPTKRNTSKNSHMIYRGKKKTSFVWIDSSIYKILTSAMYIGKRMYKGKEYPVPHLAILDEATFNLAQEHLKTRNQFKNTTNRYEYLLKGLIRCPVCGGKFYGKINIAGGNNNYACNSNRIGRSCGNRGINIEYLDALICDNVKALDKLANNVFADENFVVQINLAQHSLKLAKNKIAETKKKMANLITMSEELTMEVDDVRSRIQELQTELNNLKDEETRLNKELTIANDRDNIIQLAKELSGKFKKAKTFNEKRDLLRNIIQEITIEFTKDEYGPNGEPLYAIAIYFKINQLQNYLMAKQILVSRHLQGGKAVSTILSEKVSLTGVVFIDENDKKLSDYGYVNYGEAEKF